MSLIIKNARALCHGYLNSLSNFMIIMWRDKMKKLKKSRIVILSIFFTFMFSMTIYAADYHTWYDRTLNGGVGNYGYNNRYYFIDSSAINAGNETLTVNAMNSWIYTSNIVTTPISFQRTTTKSESIMDIYNGSYYPAEEYIYGETLFWLSGTRIYPYNPDGSNWAWTQIHLNTVSFNTLSQQRKQGVIAHEMGHVMGLAHNQDWGPIVLMYPYGDELTVSSPTSHDLFGINHLY